MVRVKVMASFASMLLVLLADFVMVKFGGPGGVSGTNVTPCLMKRQPCPLADASAEYDHALMRFPRPMSNIVFPHICPVTPTALPHDD